MTNSVPILASETIHNAIRFIGGGETAIRKSSVIPATDTDVASNSDLGAVIMAGCVQRRVSCRSLWPSALELTRLGFRTCLWY